MKYSLINHFNAINKLSPEDQVFVESVANFRGISLAEAVGLDLPHQDITPEDYAQWLDLIKAFAEDEGADLDSPSGFQDVAFEVLDNDPKMDLYGGSEDIKQAIVNTLYHGYRAQASHSSASEVARAPRPEENEEQTSTKGDDLMSRIYNNPVLQKVYQSAVSAGQNDAAEIDGTTKTKSKYVRGCTRDKVWKLGYSHGTVKK